MNRVYLKLSTLSLRDIKGFSVNQYRQIGNFILFLQIYPNNILSNFKSWKTYICSKNCFDLFCIINCKIPSLFNLFSAKTSSFFHFRIAQKYFLVRRVFDHNPILIQLLSTKDIFNNNSYTIVSLNW